MSETTLGTETQAQKEMYKKVMWHLMPLVCVLYFVAFIDRSALAFAGPNGMNDELGLTAAAFGLASGIFFLGYVLFEIPSNLALQRFGARVWLARIIVSWGIVQTLTAFVTNDVLLNIARVLLGIAEAGLAPGVLLYLTYWLPARHRVVAFGTFLVMAVVSGIIGGPLVTLLIEWGNALHWDFSGWRFMLLMTGIVPILLGVVTFLYLPDNPAKARWLTASEKQVIVSDLALDSQNAPARSSETRAGWRSGKVWLMALGYLALPYAAYTLTFFLPEIIGGFQEEFGVTYSPLQIALLTSVPSIFGAAMLFFVVRSVAKRGKPGMHILIVALIAACGALATIGSSSPLVSMVALSLTALGAYVIPTVMYSMVPKLFSLTALAIAFALIGAVGNLGGFLGPYVTGSLMELTGSDTIPFIIVATMLVGCGLIFYLLDRHADTNKEMAQDRAGQQAGVGVEQH